MKTLKTMEEKIKTLIACSLFNFVLTFVIQQLFNYPIIETQITNGLPLVYGLLFGIYGSLGIILGGLVSNIYYGFSPELILFIAVMQFVGSYLPYKLWYSFNLSGEIKLPRFNNVKSILKFIVIILVTAIIVSGLFDYAMTFNSIPNLIHMNTLDFVFNIFDYSMISGITLITIANYYEIRILKPVAKKTNKNYLKIFNGLLAIGFTICFIHLIYGILTGNTSHDELLGIIAYISIFIYCFKPITTKVNYNISTKTSLTEKLIIYFIIILLALAIVISVIFYFNIPHNEHIHIEFWSVMYTYIAIILVVFYIFSIIVLRYIEKKVAIPIESLSRLTKNYVDSYQNNENKSYEIARTCEEYNDDRSEVGILTNSFKNMVDDFEVYTDELKTITSETAKIKTELEIAKKIQLSAITKKFPPLFETNNINIYGTIVSEKDIGGDFYDFFYIDNNHLAIVIADVSGKGIPAALFMIVTKTLLQKLTYLGKSPSEVFEYANNDLYEDHEANMFVTAWMGILEIDTGKLTYVNAGHKTPLIKDSTNKYQELPTKTGLVLGVRENTKYKENIIYLKKKDRLFLYTNGIIDAIDKNKSPFGKDRLINILNSNIYTKIDNLIFNIKKEVDSFTGEVDLLDDIAMLIVEYNKNNDNNDK
ncbi:PP2C family protein-serine/threonine phosphatase [Methanobrevibacter sp. DSM 116169]|uniref:PP2C family protein-serine/threonine phosphatase n=1 Tax=Methanobrevibacter sp. DSM 116169 TaxID=3242727 RepID=UPI0038FC2506